MHLMDSPATWDEFVRRIRRGIALISRVDVVLEAIMQIDRDPEWIDYRNQVVPIRLVLLATLTGIPVLWWMSRFDRAAKSCRGMLACLETNG